MSENERKQSLLMTPAEIMRLIYQTAATAIIIVLFMLNIKNEFRDEIKEQKNEILATVNKDMSLHGGTISDNKSSVIKLSELLQKKLDDNEDEHDEFVSLINQLALNVRDFNGLVQGVINGQGELMYEVRINRTKIDGLYNPDYEEK